MTVINCEELFLLNTCIIVIIEKHYKFHCDYDNGYDVAKAASCSVMTCFSGITITLHNSSSLKNIFILKLNSKI